MKKRKILYLFPLAALVLSGCTFQEGWEIAKNWTNDTVLTPVVDFFKGIFGIEDKKDDKKDEKPSGEDQKPDEGGDQGGDHGGEGGGGEGQQTEHAGTLEDPLTGADAVAIADGLEAGGVTPDFYYVKGEVTQFQEEFNPQFGNYSFMIKGGFIGWRLKYGENKAKFGENDIEIGDTVLMYVTIQAYGEDKLAESKDGYVVSVEKKAIDAELLEVQIQGTPKTSYIAGEKYTTEGLKLIGFFDNGEEHDVSMSATWDISKETAEVGDTSITITAGYLNCSNSISVDVEVVDGSATKHAGTAEDPFDAVDAIVIAKTLEETTDPNNRHPSEKFYYIKGVVQEMLDSFNSTYGNFTFLIEHGFEGYRLLNGENKDKFTSADALEVGDTVTMYAQILNFKGTYETNDGYIAAIEKPLVAVEQVVLTDESLSLEVGQQTALGASVLPAKASQEVTWDIGQTTQVVSFENGMVLALAEGQAIITATSVADPTVSASCEVTVTEATKELLSIAITGTPKTEYNEGDAYTAEGLKVMAHYNVGDDEDVTANATIELSKAKAELGDTSFTVTASYGTAQPAELVVNVTVAEVNQFAEAYAAAKALSSGETEKYTIKGVIVAKRQNNEWFIQHNGYGIEYYGNNENFAVGKEVKVVATFQNFNGLPETKTIESATVLGDGTMPTALEINSVAAQTAANLNVLANVSGVAKADASSYAASADYKLILETADGDLTVFIKKNLFSALETEIKAIKAGDEVAISNVVTSTYKTDAQLLLCAGSTLSVTPAPEKVIASITSVTGPTEVALNGTVSTNDVTVVVEYTDGSSGNAKVTAVTVDTSSAGEKTADVTIEGWNETLHFNITVSSTAPETINDVLDRAFTGVTGTSYTDWSNKKASSNAVYAGQSAGGNESIQLRSKNSNSGIITTTSGGKLKKVIIVWNSSTTDGNKADIYCSNTAYTSPTQLYGTPVGTKVGSITKGTSTELEITGDYTFVGVRSNNGAIYITSITFVWGN